MDKLITQYVNNGWCIIPINHRDKMPPFPWKKYQTEHPTPKELKQWFNNDSQTNVALVCGKISGNGYWHVVIDIDDKENEKAVVRYARFKDDMKRRGIDIENLTLIARTQRGYHIHLLVKVEVKSCVCGGLEIRSDGWIALLPPSRNKNGYLYSWLNPQVTEVLKIEDLTIIGIDVNQRKDETPQGGKTWVSDAMEGVKAGVNGGDGRDHTCVRLAGYYLGKSMPPDVVKAILYPFAEKCEQPPGDTFGTKDVDKVVDSVDRAERTKEDNTGVDKALTTEDNSSITRGVYNPSLNTCSDVQELASKRDNFGTTSGQDWGKYSALFDEVCQASGTIDKRVLADALGLRQSSDTFRKILSRRINKKVRSYRGSPNIIQWIKRDWKATDLEKSSSPKMLDIRIPLGIDTLAQLPERAVFGVSGFTGAGKTSFLLDMAELNAKHGTLPVYYWYNEMSESQLRTRIEDYPYLKEAQKQGKFHAIPQEGFDAFADVVMPEAINLIDYLDRNEEYYLLADDIQKLYQAISTGIVVFGQQKPHGRDAGYGGYQTIKLASLYIALDIRYQEESAQYCKAKIVKCREWKDQTRNPKDLTLYYHTGPKHGVLIKDDGADGKWDRRG